MTVENIQDRMVRMTYQCVQCGHVWKTWYDKEWYSFTESDSGIYHAKDACYKCNEINLPLEHASS